MTKILQSIIIYSVGYGLFLTIFSIIRKQSIALDNQTFNSILGFAMIGFSYFYLNWSLKKQSLNSKLSRKRLILIGALVTIIGCTLSTTALWFYNENLGLQNEITNSIRAILVNGVLGLVFSIIISGKIPMNDIANADIEEKEA